MENVKKGQDQPECMDYLGCFQPTLSYINDIKGCDIRDIVSSNLVR